MIEKLKSLCAEYEITSEIDVNLSFFLDDLEALITEATGSDGTTPPPPGEPPTSQKASPRKGK